MAGGTILRAFIPAIVNALSEQKKMGVVGGYLTVDFKAVLLDGEAHSVDSNALTFAIAARACFREAMAMASSIFLEPIMRVVRLCPDELVGGVTVEIVRRLAAQVRRSGRGPWSRWRRTCPSWQPSATSECCGPCRLGAHLHRCFHSGTRLLARRPKRREGGQAPAFPPLCSLPDPG